MLEEKNMQKGPQSWLFLAAAATLAAGCAAITTTSDDDGRAVRLPTGVTLLESDRTECEGTVTIDEASVASARRSDLVIQPGENATFEVDADQDDLEIDWVCVGASDTERETVECPDETSYVRVTRAAAGDEFLFECFGDRDDRDRDR
jgi:hypothetical protein